MSDTAHPLLSPVTIAFAAMFYVAAVILLFALASRLWRFVRHPQEFILPPVPGPERDTPVPLALATNLVLFRSTFFTDRVQWLFSACFHFGLLLVLLRHLRYALNPDWLGPLWQLVVLVQPFGLYGGMVMIIGVAGYLARHLLVRDVRATTRPLDLCVLLLLLIIPIVGYGNSLAHTDVVAVKQFFVGLATFHWQPLPNDSLLLLHLWLVALLVIALPFSDLLHMKGAVVHIEVPGAAASQRLRRFTLGGLVLLLLAPLAIGVVTVVDQGWTVPQPDFSKLARAHKNLDQTVMIRNHPNFLMHTRSIVVYQGQRKEINSIEECVVCHAVKGADGQPVGFDDPKHFCVGCHRQAAVSIDCFECHNSKPADAKEAALVPSGGVAGRLAFAPPDFAAGWRAAP